MERANGSNAHRSVFSAALVFSIVASPALAAQATQTAQVAQVSKKPVHGVVHDSAGARIALAQVSVAGMTPVTTGPDGAFAISLAPGVALLTIRRLGFHPAEIEIETASLGNYPIDISLVPIARSLEPVRILARREPSDARLAGFNQRLARHAGYFITRDQIERTANSRLIDALRRLPGVRVVTLRGAQGRSVTLGGASCPPLVYIDGFPATAGALDLDMIELGSLEGVEVYSTASAIPAELIGPHGLDRCGVIALWSSPSRARKVADVDPEDVASLVEAGAVFTAEQVDTTAQYEPGTADPVYPAAQLQNRVRGRVVIEFVVDTLGGVEPGSINVVTASAAVFGEAARSAVARGRFSPAVLNSRRVRQVVRIGLDFDPGALSPAPADSGPHVPLAPQVRSPQRS